jgi:hypothetical protein
VGWDVVDFLFSLFVGVFCEGGGGGGGGVGGLVGGGCGGVVVVWGGVRWWVWGVWGGCWLLSGCIPKFCYRCVY